MSQLIAIFLLFVFLFFRMSKKSSILMQQRKQDHPSYPAPVTEESASIHNEAAYEEVRPFKTYEPAFSSITRHGEDSIDHDHWETMEDYPHHSEPGVSPQTAEEKDLDRIHTNKDLLYFNENQYYKNFELLPEMNAQGIVKAVIMQEVLGSPRARQRK